MRRSAKGRHALASLMVGAAVIACNGGGRGGDDEVGAADSIGVTKPQSQAAAASAATTVRTAKVPNDPCSWVSAAEVEEIIGTKIVGAPTPNGNDCHYPYALDSATLVLKSNLRESARKLMGPDAPLLKDSTWDKGSVFVSVDVRATAANTRDTTNGPVPPGWDDATRFFGRFRGRVGHVLVTVGQKSERDRKIPMETKGLLADRVRGRIPDLPFANPNGRGSTSMSSGPDPCSVITRADAEAVLGPLVVEPFRIGEAEPFPDAGGKSCGYFTPNHHLLIVTPYWSDGKSELGIRRGVGKLISMVAPDAEAAAADTLEGSWDEAAKDLDGSLLFLKGDRLLRVSFATSSANGVQALRLAGKGVDRLASASPR